MPVIRSIEDLRNATAGRLVAWVGSGLSVPPPTRLPTAAEFLVSLMRLDWVRGDRKIPYDVRWPWSQALRGMRFEHVLSVFHTQWRGHPVQALLGQFAEAQPNGYHRRIAALGKAGVVQDIVTTNFDQCLEQALDREGVRFHRIVSRSDQFRPGELNLFKIHGTIDRPGGQPVEMELAATLEALAQGLPPWRARILTEITQDATVVFLGYSGSDSYDINPALRARSGFPALWLAHGDAKPGQPPLSPEARALTTHSPWPEPLVCDTATFLGAQLPEPETRPPFTLRPTFDAALGHRDAAVFVGCVLTEVDNWSAARDYYAAALAAPWVSAVDTTDYLDLRRGHAVSCYELGDVQAARESFAQAHRDLDAGLGRSPAHNDEADTPRDWLHTDQLLLLGEEEAVLAARTGDAEAARRLMGQAWAAWEKLKAPPDRHRLVRARLLLNQAQVELAIQASSGLLDPPTLRHGVERLLESLEIKAALGDFPGIVAVRAALSLHLLGLNRAHDASRQLFDMVTELRRLQTPIRPTSLFLGISAAGFQVAGQLRAGGGKSLPLYLAHTSDTKDRFQAAIQDCLLTRGFADWDTALAALCADHTVADLGRRLLAELDSASPVTQEPTTVTQVPARVTQPPTTSPGRDRMPQAISLAQSGHLDAAIRIFDDIIERAPDDADAWLHRSSLKYAQGRVAEALAELRLATATFPRDARLLSNLGNVLYECGQAQQALEPLRQAITLDPADAYAWNNLGNCLHHLGRYANAVPCYEKAIALRGGHFPPAEGNLATTRRALAERRT